MRCVSILALIAALTLAPDAAPARPLAPARPAPGITSGVITHAFSIFPSDSREYVGLALTPVSPVRSTPPVPTPEIRVIEALNIKGMVAYAMRGSLGNSGEYVGLAVLCAIHGQAEIEATAFFGAFPGAHRPVQLAVRSPDGAVERFGQVLAGGPESGFHSPQLRDPHDAQRFVTVALHPGALISNGYRSFWNRASEQRNQQVRDEFLACVQRPREKAATK